MKQIFLVGIKDNDRFFMGKTLSVDGFFDMNESSAVNYLS